MSLIASAKFSWLGCRHPDWPAPRRPVTLNTYTLAGTGNAAAPAMVGLTQNAGRPQGAGRCILLATALNPARLDFLYRPLPEQHAGIGGWSRRVGRPGCSNCAALNLQFQADRNRTPAPARRLAPGPGRAAAARPPPIRAGRFAPGIRDSRSDSRRCRGAGLTV